MFISSMDDFDRMMSTPSGRSDFRATVISATGIVFIGMVLWIGLYVIVPAHFVGY